FFLDENSQSYACVRRCHSAVRCGVFPARQGRSEFRFSVRQGFSWPLGFDAESARPRVSFLARTSRGKRAAESRDDGPLGKPPAASDRGVVEWPPEIRLSQRGGRKQ